MPDVQLVDTIVTHYVRYFGPGLVTDEENDVVVLSRDIHEVATNAPSYVDAFVIYDVVTITAYIDGQLIKTTSDKLDVSERYYIDAQKLSFDELEKRLPGNRPAIRQLKAQGGDYVILCRSGQLQHARRGDTFIKVGVSEVGEPHFF